MPNYCENELTIEVTNNQEDLSDLIDKYTISETTPSDISSDIDTRTLDFQKIIPMPEELLINGWYEWRIKNWNTKWNAVATHFEKYPEIAILCFDTAWSPPLDITKKLAKLYPSLKFIHKYCEPGMCFAGKVIYKNGKRTIDYFTENVKAKIFKDFGCNFDQN